MAHKRYRRLLIFVFPPLTSKNYKRKRLKNKGRTPKHGVRPQGKVIGAIELVSRDLIPSAIKSLSIQFMDFGGKVIQNRFKPEVLAYLKKF
jgi:hypothetical protein